MLAQRVLGRRLGSATIKGYRCADRLSPPGETLDRIRTYVPATGITCPAKLPGAPSTFDASRPGCRVIGAIDLSGCTSGTFMLDGDRRCAAGVGPDRPATSATWPSQSLGALRQVSACEKHWYRRAFDMSDPISEVMDRWNQTRLCKSASPDISCLPRLAAARIAPRETTRR
jgi:hypothetical protein